MKDCIRPARLCKMYPSSWRQCFCSRLRCIWLLDTTALASYNCCCNMVLTYMQKTKGECLLLHMLSYVLWSITVFYRLSCVWHPVCVHTGKQMFDCVVFEQRDICDVFWWNHAYVSMLYLWEWASLLVWGKLNWMLQRRWSQYVSLNVTQWKCAVIVSWLSHGFTNYRLFVQNSDCMKSEVKSAFCKETVHVCGKNYSYNKWTGTHCNLCVDSSLELCKRRVLTAWSLLQSTELGTRILHESLLATISELWMLTACCLKVQSTQN